MDVHAYARCGKRDCLLALLDGGYDVDATDTWEWTPLMCAAQAGHTDCVQLLLERGADASKSDDDKLTAVHCAIAGGHLEVLRLLLASTVDPTTLDPMFNTLPFMRANAFSFALACGCGLKAPRRAIEASGAGFLRPIICGYSLPHLL